MWQSGIMKTKKLEYTVIGAGAALLASLAFMFLARSHISHFISPEGFWDYAVVILAYTVFCPGVIAGIFVEQYLALLVGVDWAVGIGWAVGIFTMTVIGGGLGLLIELIVFPRERFMGVPQRIFAHTVFWPGVVAGIVVGQYWAYSEENDCAVGIGWAAGISTMMAIGLIIGLFVKVVRLWLPAPRQRQ